MYVAVRVITGVALNSAVTLSNSGYGPFTAVCAGASRSDWYDLRSGFCSVSRILASWKQRNRLALKRATRSRWSSPASSRIVTAHSSCAAAFAP